MRQPLFFPFLSPNFFLSFRFYKKVNFNKPFLKKDRFQDLLYQKPRYLKFRIANTLTVRLQNLHSSDRVRSIFSLLDPFRVFRTDLPGVQILGCILTLMRSLICGFCSSDQRFAHGLVDSPHPTSFRFAVTCNTLAFGYILPITGQIRDLHPLETCAARYTVNFGLSLLCSDIVVSSAHVI